MATIPPHQERRRSGDSDLCEIRELLLDMKETLDAHVAKLNGYEPELIEVINLLKTSKGVLSMVKLLIFLGTPVAAVLIWLADTFKFRN